MKKIVLGVAAAAMMLSAAAAAAAASAQPYYGRSGGGYYGGDAYSRDSDVTAFSASDLAGINEIWTRVAEDFDAPLPDDVLIRPLE